MRLLCLRPEWKQTLQGLLCIAALRNEGTCVQSASVVNRLQQHGLSVKSLLISRLKSIGGRNHFRFHGNCGKSHGLLQSINRLQQRARVANWVKLSKKFNKKLTLWRLNQQILLYFVLMFLFRLVLVQGDNYKINRKNLFRKQKNTALKHETRTRKASINK